MQQNTDSSLEVGSLVSPQTQRSFDVQNEHDVVSLLRLIHINPVDTETKNQLRDRIFAYRQSPDPALLTEISQLLGAFAINVHGGNEQQTPVAVETPAPATPTVRSLGMGRPKPRFSVVATPTAPEAVTQTAPTPPVAVTETPVVPPVAEVSVQQPQAQVQQEVATPPVSVPTLEAVHTVEYQDPMGRIQEIKHIVNQKVGNPVKLIESHSEIGHEYMSALLDAMKKATGGGAQGDLNAAMQRLESAFAQVSALEMNVVAPASTPVSVAPSIPTPQPTPEPIIESVPTPPPLPSQEPEPVVPRVEKETHTSLDRQVKSFESTLTEKEPEPIVPTLSPTPTEQTSVPKPIARFTSVKKQLEATDALPKAPEVTPPAEVQPVTAPVSKIPLQEVPAVVRTEQAIPQAPVAEESVESLPDIHSVGKEKQLQDLLRSKRQKEATTELQKEQERIAAMDPLQTPEVTAGLSQLLSEWGLFKSSGIFGMGPSGKDHVLYKRIAPLTMAAVIAGRFEGATPQIKQSITDYMNGWRYEEGIVHEHGETFEHYLRRVIFHILNKKKLAA